MSRLDEPELFFSSIKPSLADYTLWLNFPYFSPLKYSPFWLTHNHATLETQHSGSAKQWQGIVRLQMINIFMQ
jgi:hypothetical protein